MYTSQCWRRLRVISKNPLFWWCFSLWWMHWFVPWHWVMTGLFFSLNRPFSEQAKSSEKYAKFIYGDATRKTDGSFVLWIASILTSVTQLSERRHLQSSSELEATQWMGSPRLACQYRHPPALKLYGTTARKKHVRLLQEFWIKYKNSHKKK